MKNLKVIALVSILTFLTNDAFGGWFQDWRMKRQQRQVAEKTAPGDAVGAPLDGGLLTILAAAGATYYGVRRKKKKGTE